MNQHYKKIHRYDFLTKEILAQEYTINGLFDAQIAKKFNIPSKVIVWRKRKKFGIPNRYAAKSNRHASKNRKHNITKAKAVQLLAEGQTYKEIAQYMGCSLIVARRRFQELGLTKCQNHTEHYKYWDVNLTASQKQMIMGSVLGDGTIAKQGAYSCSHSVKQADYHKHKRQVLASIHSGKFQHAIHKAQGVDGKHYESLHFTTGCNEFCSQLRSIFYPHGKKIFPYPFLMGHLRQEALAYWYMDDGSYSQSAKLCTYGFPLLAQLLIRDLLWTKFAIKSRIKYRKERNDYYHYFPVTETRKLFNLIQPFVIPSMTYKLGTTP